MQITGYFGAHRTAATFEISNELWDKMIQAHAWIRSTDFDAQISIWGIVADTWTEVHVFRQDASVPVFRDGTCVVYTVSVPH